MMRNAILFMATIWMCVGCSAARIDNTRLASSDLVAMTERMVRSLLADTAIAGRGADATPWWITIDRVSNQTNDIIPDREKWAFVARLRARLAESSALKHRNIHFVLQAPRRAVIHTSDNPRGSVITTHALTATFHSLTNAFRTGRTDTYHCAFELLDLKTDRIVWEDRYEVKKGTVRNRLD